MKTIGITFFIVLFSLKAAYSQGTQRVTLSMTEVKCTSLNENLQDELLKFYPNPASEFLQIQSYELNLQIILIDMQGREVISERIVSGSSKIDLSALSNGIYLLRAIGQHDRSSIDKIIIQR